MPAYQVLSQTLRVSYQHLLWLRLSADLNIASFEVSPLLVPENARISIFRTWLVVDHQSAHSLNHCSVHAAKRNEYQAFETKIFDSLASLVKDAASLRVYLAAAMRVEAEAFTRATL